MPVRWQCPHAVETRTYTARSDVYSFGVLMWEVFHHGGTPYRELAMVEVVRAVKNGAKLQWASKPPPPPAIVQLSQLCASKAPSQRPVMSWVRQQLTALVASDNVQAATLQDLEPANGSRGTEVLAASGDTIELLDRAGKNSRQVESMGGWAVTMQMVEGGPREDVADESVL